jgi:hypothetical protein
MKRLVDTCSHRIACVLQHLEPRLLLSLGASEADTTPPFISALHIAGNDVLAEQRIIYPLDQFTLFVSESLYAGAGPGDPHSVLNPANYHLTRNGQEVSAQIASVAHAFNSQNQKFEITLRLSSPILDGSYLLSVSDQLHDLAGNALDANLDGTPGGEDAGHSFVIRSVAPQGPEFLVHASSPLTRRLSAVAADAAGDFVIAWVNYYPDTTNDISARLFNAAGVPLALEFSVSAATSGAQHEVAAAMDDRGNFVIAWTQGSFVLARVFDAAGTAKGSSFAVDATAGAFGADVDFDAQGNFVVSWKAGSSSFARRFDSNGKPIIGEIYFAGRTSAAIASAADGRFIATYQAWLPNRDYSDIIARRYDAQGLPIGDEFIVNSDIISQHHVWADVATDAHGNFIVAWNTVDIHFKGYGIYAQFFDAAGQKKGNEFRVDQYIPSDEPDVHVAMDADGDFVVTWASLNQDGDARGIYARRYDADARPRTNEFLVHSSGIGDQFHPAIAMDADGDFISSWTLNFKVYARIFAANQAPTALAIPSVNVPQNAPDTNLQLRNYFQDPNTAPTTLNFTILSNTSPILFTSTTINNSTGVLTLNYSPTYAGQAAITIRATDPDGLSVDSSFNITVRPTGNPQVQASSFIYQTSPQRLIFSFNHDVHSSLSSASIQLERLSPNPTPINISEPLWNPSTNTATFTFSGILPDGNYRATLLASGVTNSNNASMSSDYLLPFFFLAGDLNHDASVSISDFITLASNFNKTNATYSDGDINYDGTVSIADFITLASKFNTTLPAFQPAVPEPAASEIITTTPSPTDDLLDKKDRKPIHSRHPHHRHPHHRKTLHYLLRHRD